MLRNFTTGCQMNNIMYIASTWDIEFFFYSRTCSSGGAATKAEMSHEHCCNSVVILSSWGYLDLKLCYGQLDQFRIICICLLTIVFMHYTDGQHLLS